MRVFPPFVILISALILQGCVFATIIGTAAVGTKVLVDPRTVGTQIDDSILELRVKNAISKDNLLKKKARVNATIYKGKVLLIGQVPNTRLAFHAKKITMDIKGVCKVFNEIREGHPINIGDIFFDIWLTTKIRSQLLISNQVKFSNLKITTENKEVFLFGSVTKREGKAAVDIASHTSGVKHVVMIPIYID